MLQSEVKSGLIIIRPVADKLLYHFVFCRSVSQVIVIISRVNPKATKKY